MPTTCGFPSCKFRSRYRGQEDNRHFYRIPKRPLVLRQRWLKAIGRTEETVVSQLRICSAHFRDGEKREGDIPVPDPELDTPLSICLPPKENKTVEKRRSTKSTNFGLVDAMKRLTNPPVFNQNPLLSNPFSSTPNYERLNFPSQVANPRNRLNNMFVNGNSTMAAFMNAFKCVAGNKNNSLSGKQIEPVEVLNGIFNESKIEEESMSVENAPSPTLNSCLRSANRVDVNPLDEISEQSALASSILNFNSNFGNSALMRPLVALLDGRDCSVEMALLKDIATVAFCDAQIASEIHERVLNEAVVAFVCHSIRLQREDLQKFKCLKAIIRIGTGIEQFDLTAATELGIAICHTNVQCIEERVDSTLSLILNLYRRTFWTARTVQNNSCPQGIEQLRELASGSRRIRGSRLLIIGLGQIGTAVALRAAAFGFQISFYDPLLADGVERSFGFTRYIVLEEALAEADCITFHCPLNAKTKRFVNMTLLKKMKKSVFIVNIGSDQLFVESDLLTCLKNGQIGAAAFDCYSPSNSFSTSLASLPNVICTPKISWYSDSSCKELREAAARQVRQILLGDVKSPADFQNCINREALMSQPTNSTPIPSQPSTSSSFIAQRPLPTDFSFNSPAYQNLYMMNAGNILGQSSMGLYPQQLINQLNLTNGNNLQRKEANSVTPRDDRPSSSSSSNQNNFGNFSANLNDERRSSSAVSINGQETEEDQKVNVLDENDGPAEKIPKLEIDESENKIDEVDQPTSSA